MIKSILYRPTGKFDSLPAGPHQRLNSAGELMEADELRHGSYLTSIRNNSTGDIESKAAGVQIILDTLTYIKRRMVEQKFFEVPVADYLPLVVGEGAFAESLLHTLAYSNSDDFESGIINQATGGAQLSLANASVSSLTRKVVTWAKAIQYTIVELEQALLANNWDAIAAKHSARKKNWDLGIQRIAFLGSKTDGDLAGLLNSPEVTVDTATITKPIKQMTAAEITAFVGNVIALYRANASQTAMPNRFVIPQSDYYGLGVLTPGTTGTFPISLLAFLEDTFKRFIPDFKILPLAYADADYNDEGANLYTLFRYDTESVVMDIPVNITATQPNSVNNFQFQDAAYGQFTGVAFLRPHEALQFRY
ncbi:MAG: DUF2184 domain-containing protein [Opitutaceae bacterium]|jgi:hypothetical protein|nr:DUF2184 domain-containing protein [Opitutaceae bacterium]